MNLPCYSNTKTTGFTNINAIEHRTRKVDQNGIYKLIFLTKETKSSDSNSLHEMTTLYTTIKGETKPNKENNIKRNTKNINFE